jgi:hypothetical protein
MDYWILDNLDKLVPFVIAILYFVGSAKAKKMQEESSDRKPDPEANERARKIQEEIRRKILERQQQGRPTAPARPPEQPTIVFEDEAEEAPPVLHPAQSRSAREVAEVERRMEPVEDVWEEPADIWEDPFEEQRREIEEQLQKARELQSKAPSKGIASTKPNWQPHVSGSRRPEELRRAIREDLQDGLSVQRAIALKEILEKPIALR